MKTKRFITVGILALALILSAVVTACNKGSGESGSDGKAAAALVKKLSGTNTAVEKALSTVTPAVLAELSSTAGSPGGDFSYDLNETGDGVQIKKYTGENTVVIIPAKIEDYPVTSINGASFTGGYEWELLPYLRGSALVLGWDLSGSVETTGGSGVTTVVIPSGVTFIGYSAFRNCKKLHTVILPDTLQTIDSNAFDGAEELYNLVIPETLASLEFGEGHPYRNETGDAFAGCGKLPIKTRQRLQELGYTGKF
jgi:hypothetical protein